MNSELNDSVFENFAGLLAQKIIGDAWIVRGQELKIAGIPLAADNESKQISMFQAEGKL